MLHAVDYRGINVGVCGSPPPPPRNDPVSLKLSAVGLKIMRLVTHGALRSNCQSKYFRNSETYQTQTIELKICSNGIKQLRNNMKKYYQSKPTPRVDVSIYLYPYVTIMCLHFYLEFRFCKVIHG